MSCVTSSLKMHELNFSFNEVGGRGGGSVHLESRVPKVAESGRK